VYHGPTSTANDYFYNLNYLLPQGESVADWLIDISSGRLEPELDVALSQQAEKDGSKRPKKIISMLPAKRKSIKGKETATSTEEEPLIVNSTSREIEVSTRPQEFRDTENGVATGERGLSGGRAWDAFEAAKVRRAWLYDEWNEYFMNLSDEEKEHFQKPEMTKLPRGIVKQSFISQLYNQTTRAVLVSWRNSTEKLIDTSVLVLATIVLCLMSKVPTMTMEHVPDITFDDVVRPTQASVHKTLRELFTFAAVPQIPYVSLSMYRS
jgi:hypothetical protein